MTIMVYAFFAFFKLCLFNKHAYFMKENRQFLFNFLNFNH